MLGDTHARWLRARDRDGSPHDRDAGAVKPRPQEVCRCRYAHRVGTRWHHPRSRVASKCRVNARHFFGRDFDADRRDQPRMRALGRRQRIDLAMRKPFDERRVRHAINFVRRHVKPARPLESTHDPGTFQAAYEFHEQQRNALGSFHQTTYGPLGNVFRRVQSARQSAIALAASSGSSSTSSYRSARLPQEGRISRKTGRDIVHTQMGAEASASVAYSRIDSVASSA